MSEKTEFPYPAPPAGLLVPVRGDHQLSPEEMVQVVRTFCTRHHHKNLDIPEGSALGRWLEVAWKSALVASPEEQKLKSAEPAPGGQPTEHADALDVVGLIQLEWAIRVLQNAPKGRFKLDGGFINELYDPDLPMNDVRYQDGPLMPAGVKTLALAARLYQADGGTIWVRSAGSKGRDIQWCPASGGRVWLERKDRAYRAAKDDSENGFWSWVKDKLKHAPVQMPAKPDVARVVSVGAFVEFHRARRLQKDFMKIVHEVPWQNINQAFRPDAVCLHLVGHRLNSTEPGNPWCCELFAWSRQVSS